jgi:predicted CopG family antitoxin
MYIHTHIHIMAKNIMVSNEAYARMKKIKGNRSFTKVIVDALESSNPERKTIGNLIRKHAGALKGDTEYDEIMKSSRKRWKEWQDRSYKSV